MDPVSTRSPVAQPQLEGRARYRIAAVSELTGVPEPTLRAWERRYGVPAPERTGSGYRLYADADIRVVREMRRLCDDGMAAAEAARVTGHRDEPRDERGASAAADGAVAVAGTAFALSVAAILAAIERFDDVALDREIRRLMYIGGATEVLDQVLSPVFRIIGRRWHEGTLGVAQEHLATEKLGTVMRDLVRLLPGATATRSAVLACFADDEHELGLLGVAIRLSERGLRPVFLGARTPPAAIRAAVAAARPELVALSLTLTPTRARARALLADYAAACGDVPWMAGGAGVGPVADLVTRFGGSVVTDGRAFPGGDVGPHAKDASARSPSRPPTNRRRPGRR